MIRWTKSPAHRALLATVCAMLLLLPDAAFAQPRGGGPGSFATLAVTPIHQPQADIDGGGEFSLSGVLLRVGFRRPVSRTTVLGISFKYDYDNYDFSAIDEFDGEQPWGDVRRFGIGVPVFSRFAESWLFGITPSVNWLQEVDADSGDSLSYGAPVFVSKGFARDRIIGLGASVFRNVEGDLDVFPFIAVDWRFDEHWRLANPVEADVLGPAGLELSYRLNDRWSLGAGGVYRSFRFRLDDEGVAPGGIGENNGTVAFVHLGRDRGDGLGLDFYVGATLNGTLELLNADGDRLASSGYATAPLLAFTIRAAF